MSFSKSKISSRNHGANPEDGEAVNKEKQKLSFQQIGRGFIVNEPVPGIPPGRRLAKAYVDRFKRKFIIIDGEYEILTQKHNFLMVE